MEIKTNYFESRGVKIKYFEMGEGQPVIFLHGVGVKALTYNKLLELLATRYHVIVPDLPCFGGSGVPKEIWDFSDFAIFFNEFINSLNLGNLILIGHSFGGGIACNLAAINNKISKLVLVSSSGITPNVSILQMIYNLMIKKTIYSMRHYNGFMSVRSDFIKNVIHNFFHLRHVFKTVINCTYKDYQCFQDIKCPTLILWGTDDEVIPASFAEKFHEKIKGSEVKMIDGNHDWILFKPELLIEKIIALR